MQRYFLDENDFNLSVISNDDAFHIIKVMRGKIGDRIEVCFDSKVYLAEIISLDSIVTYKIIEELPTFKTKNEYTLIQGLPKGDKLDEILMHSTELNVANIILVEMDWSIAKIKNEDLTKRLARFTKICKEASEQSHRSTVPNVSYFKGLNKINYDNYDLKLLLDEEEAKKETPRFLNDLKIGTNQNICFVVGPEGGISPKERDYLINVGFIPIALTKSILRTETASLSMLAQFDYKEKE